MNSRKMHAYCLGVPKTGTHSVAGMFARHYRSAHEPRAGEMIYYSTLFALNEQNSKEYMRERDQALQLDMEANHLLSSFVEVLVDEFPEAKFLITIRDCYDWLQSMINQHAFVIKLVSDYPDDELSGLWGHWHECMVRCPENRYDSEDKVLESYKLYPIKDYLLYWKSVNQKLLDSIPRERRMFVETIKLLSSMRQISDFLGVPYDSLDQTASHRAKTQKKFVCLPDLVNPEYLRECITFYCGDLLPHLIPSI